MSRRATINDLPPELLAQVFARLRQPNGEMTTVKETRSNATPLLTVALVSKVWAELALKELYCTLWMPRSDDYENRARQWLESQARTRHIVRKLWLPRVGTAVGRQVLAACPNLRHLTLPDDFDREPWEFLRSLPRALLSNAWVHSKADWSVRSSHTPEPPLPGVLRRRRRHLGTPVRPVTFTPMDRRRRRNKAYSSTFERTLRTVGKHSHLPSPPVLVRLAQSRWERVPVAVPPLRDCQPPQPVHRK